MESTKLDKTKIEILDINKQGNDFVFWQTQSYETRLSTLERLREEYNLWRYGNQQRFQRVYRIVEQK